MVHAPLQEAAVRIAARRSKLPNVGLYLYSGSALSEYVSAGMHMNVPNIATPTHLVESLIASPQTTLSA